ncbi:MAG: sigma-70 family RNA polymerase sigma factor [Planctomycetes bacterium]|nr:sigma-70 family RNA polymerase sigma factor [Planctomycetota bacterium]
MTPWFRNSDRRNQPGSLSDGVKTSPPQPATLARDRALIQRWQQGDQDAGLELLDHYAALTRLVAFRLGVRDQQAVLDLYQDLVVRVLEKLPTLDEQITASFAGWLAWQVRDLAQRRTRGMARGTIEYETWMGETAADPAARVTAWDAIQVCQRDLSERERTVFRLRYLEGLSLQEIADRMASNANAIAQSIFRLVRRMREGLRTQGYDLSGAEP